MGAPEKEEILDLLFIKLNHKGLMPIEAIRFIKDAFNILEEDEHLSLDIIRQRLQDIGWDAHISDEQSLELVRLLFTNLDKELLDTFLLH